MLDEDVMAFLGEVETVVAVTLSRLKEKGLVAPVERGIWASN